MGLIQKALDGLNEISKAANEIAFGDVRNLFSRNRYDKPIGLFGKCYDYMVDHVTRGIGNGQHYFDGFSTPIGELSNPYYNSMAKIPWFYLDRHKSITSDYIDYVKRIYGDTFSVMNTNDIDFFELGPIPSNVGVIDTNKLNDVILGNEGYEHAVLNPNELGTDTKLGMMSQYYAAEGLRNAAFLNDERGSSKFAITKGTYENFGNNTKAISDNNIFSISDSLDSETGRFTNFSPLQNSGFLLDGSIGLESIPDIGNYFGLYDAMSDKNKEVYIQMTRLNAYYPSIRDAGRDSEGKLLYRGKGYLSTVIENIGHEELSYTPNTMLINSDNTISDVVVTNVAKMQVRYVFSTYAEHSSINDALNGGLYVYTEQQGGATTDINFASFNPGIRFGRYTSYGSNLKVNDLLKKTNDGFRNGKYETLIARFYSDKDVDLNDITQTAVSEKYGISHGRNLLKKEPDKSEGYNNPYCRTWTFHHQYSRLADAIRPLSYENQVKLNDNLKKHGINRDRLSSYGVINPDNGLVNISPTSAGGSKKVDIRHCMFSIENLAWKGSFGEISGGKGAQLGNLSEEQRGPFGGRIMWFPPYGLKFNENVSTSWANNTFIGRGEDVYTYVNTSRGGNLSFQMLIDHPSIFDYWEGRGKSNSNSVDATDDAEQVALRFLAGCDVLTSSKKEDKKNNIPPVSPIIPTPETESIYFFVFFPNDYSGQDDNADFATMYLINGLGTSKMIGNNSSDESDPIDFVPSFDNYKYGTMDVGGYEMRNGVGLSFRSNTQKYPYYVIGSEKVGGMKLATQRGATDDAAWKKKWYYRVDKKRQNEKLNKISYTDPNSYCLNSSFKVNNEEIGQKQISKTFGVNTEKLYSFADVYAALSDGAETFLESNKLCNSEKVAKFKQTIARGIEKVECVGMASVDGYSAKESTNTSRNNDLMRSRANTIKKWLSGKGLDANKIVAKVGGTGGVKHSGEHNLTNKLFRCVKVKIEVKTAESVMVQNSITNDMLEAIGKDGNTKLSLTRTNFITGSLDNNTKQAQLQVNGYSTDFGANEKVEADSLQRRNDYIQMLKFSDAVNNLAFNMRGASRDGQVNLNSLFGAVSEFTEEWKKLDYNADGEVRRVGEEVTGTNPALHDKEQKDPRSPNNSLDAKGNELAKSMVDAAGDALKDILKIRKGTNGSKGSSSRYDGEAKFFKLLEKNEPALHHKITDKIMYFDPAFHSISPEGFNARLTFLHQCTRQGPTIGSSDAAGTENTANNLAFGRPPVCILRIGDFYYTKIIIENMSIDFDPLVWDMNTEGIGMMPMIANINISFKFIGGSSLSGHINRLQNALSFNYYANTEVYDNRSEIETYDSNGKVSSIEPFVPNIG